MRHFNASRGSNRALRGVPLGVALQATGVVAAGLVHRHRPREMIAPDHVCSWTRRRRSTLSRRDGELLAAGLSRPLLEAAARHLGTPISLVPDPELDDEQRVVLGPWRGWLHDGCLLAIDGDEPRLREALVAASLALHAHYLGRPIGPERLRPLADRLDDGATLVLQSRPRERLLLASVHPNDAGWWARRMARVDRIRV